MTLNGHFTLFFVKFKFKIYLYIHAYCLNVQYNETAK